LGWKTQHWTCGRVDVWTCGRVDVWTCGRVDVEGGDPSRPSVAQLRCAPPHVSTSTRQHAHTSTLRAWAYAVSRAARLKTSRNIGWVSFPVNVFCWLGW